MLTAPAFGLDGRVALVTGASRGIGLAVVGNVSHPEDIAGAVSAVTGRWGRLDILVNNAGANPYFGRRADTRQLERSWPLGAPLGTVNGNTPGRG